jgi:alkylation response protein AidB-like acyl-CoA dehydrogenase
MAERERRVPRSLIQALQDAGLFRLKLPRQYGGAELDHVTHFRIVEDFAAIDASVAWLLAIANEFATCAGYLPREGADEIFGADSAALLAGAVKSREDDVRPVPGGYRISGRWALASGCVDATWFAAAGAIGPPSTPGPATPAHDLRFFLLPASDVTILRTWNALGLRATASHDFSVTAACVSEHRQFSINYTNSELPGALWRGNLRTQLGAPAAVALGIARAAIDALVELACDTTPLYSQAPLQDRHGVQALVGRAEAAVRGARAFLYETLSALWDTQSRGDVPAAGLLVERDLAVVHAVQRSAEAVGWMYDAAGSSAVYTDSRLERCFRDIHVLTQHVGGASNRYEQLGRFFMGLEMGPR